MNIPLAILLYSPLSHSIIIRLPFSLRNEKENFSKWKKFSSFSRYIEKCANEKSFSERCGLNFKT